jgi:hypothetical protein
MKVLVAVLCWSVATFGILLVVGWTWGVIPELICLPFAMAISFGIGWFGTGKTR